MSLSDYIIDLPTGAKLVARTTLDAMSVTKKLAANDKIEKALQTKINKEVESTILDIAHRDRSVGIAKLCPFNKECCHC